MKYLIAILCFYPVLVHSEIYKAVDADGHVTYSSVPIKGGKKIILEPLSTMMPPPAQARSDGFPKVDAATQKGRDEVRLKILQDELSTELKLLAEARQNLKNGEGTPEVFQTKDGKTFRNVSKYEEKVKSLRDQVDLHSKNVEALKTELSKFK